MLNVLTEDLRWTEQVRLVLKDRYLRDYVGPALILAGPPLVTLLLLIFHRVSWERLVQVLSRNWGNVASVWGLFIGIYVLVVATGARRAAEAARHRSRRQTLTEGLEEARNNMRQIGHFIMSGNWDVVRIKAEEVLNSCQSAMQRWDEDPLSKKAKNKLITVGTVTRSIAERAATAELNPLNMEEREEIAAAQLRAGELLSALLGESRGLQEKE
jgi:hypothetical protein